MPYTASVELRTVIEIKTSRGDVFIMHASWPYAEKRAEALAHEHITERNLHCTDRGQLCKALSA